MPILNPWLGEIVPSSNAQGENQGGFQEELARLFEGGKASQGGYNCNCGGQQQSQISICIAESAKLG